ncbi:(3,5-dihydroxyphenyl)acetyl-CoA 1,2-dioxygenase DpgC [Streptomyces uncialis]|uniref:(3,5-dihydroxyphenyl)acetyl-CoA 1,2-dioxygenase DpgC n=1 Tax=Streptomyces uncialis TaxID=1048205 RepID=UPI003657B5D2
MTTNSSIPSWQGAGTVPPFTGALHTDARALERYIAECHRLLSTLPARTERNSAEQSTAEHALRSARSARRAFLAHHTERVYALLTDDLSRARRLTDLVRAASDRFPGLLPTREQLEAERQYIQAHRDGHEIDQGVFCGAVLRSPTAGTHLMESMLLPTERAQSLAETFTRTGRIALDRVLLERRGHAAHVTFLDADCLNAEDDRLIVDLETAIDLALLDEQVRVGVLRGGPVAHPRYQGKRVFSAGINLKDLRNGAISFVDFLLTRELGYIHKLTRGLLLPSIPYRYRAADPNATISLVGGARSGAWCERLVSKPWIGAVDSFAIGGGMQLLLTLDRVIAESGAFFSLPAAAEGIVPGVGNLRLTRLTGARLARQVILSGRRIHTNDPEARLLCDEIVPGEAMDETIERATSHLGTPAVAANRHMLALGEEPLDHFREYLAEFAVVQSARAYSGDVLAKVEQRWQHSQRSGAGR